MAVSTSPIGASNLYREYSSSPTAPPMLIMGTPLTEIEISIRGATVSSIVLGVHPLEGTWCPEWEYVRPTAEMEEIGLSPFALTNIVNELNQIAKNDFDAIHPGGAGLPILISFFVVVGAPALTIVKGSLALIGVLVGIASAILFTLRFSLNEVRANDVVIENTKRFIDEELNGNSKPWFKQIRWEMKKDCCLIEITLLRPQGQDDVVSSVVAAVAQEHPVQTVYQKSVYYDSVLAERIQPHPQPVSTSN